jgi:DNA-binding NarL/FixJ family response regulator
VRLPRTLKAPLALPRLLLAEDNAAVAAQMRLLLESAYEVVGVVSSGEALETAYEVLRPAAVVTDIAMPGEGGLVAVRRLRQHHPEMPVVLLTVSDSPAMIRMGLALGVQGYVVKADAGDELVPAVEAALAGRPYMSAAAARSISLADRTT